MATNVAYISAANPIDSMGGAVNTVRNWFDALLDRGFELDVITRGETDDEYAESGVRVVELAGIEPKAAIDREIARNDYDAVLAQDGWAHLALEAADEHDVPSVMSVVTCMGEREAIADFSPTEFVANSRYTQQWITGMWGRDSALVYPHIDFDFYDAPEGSSDAVSMLNPVERKGGPIFEAIARDESDREFATKSGWYSFKTDDLEWDPDALRVQRNTFFDVPDGLSDAVYVSNGPTEVDFGDVPNVSFRSEPGILDFYARTRVLLVPSQWTEAFGRVVLEAMWNGIPVVASGIGGLPEACGGAGLLVEDYADPDAWTAKLALLDDPDVYEAFAERGRERARRFRDDQADQTDRLVAVIESAVAQG